MNINESILKNNEVLIEKRKETLFSVMMIGTFLRIIIIEK